MSEVLEANTEPPITFKDAPPLRDTTRSVIAPPRPAPAATATPRRSWQRGSRDAGTFDAKFVFEGETTVYIQSLSDNDWDEIEQSEEAIQAQGEAFQQEQEELKAEEAKPRKAGADVAGLRSRRKDLNRRMKDSSRALAEFQEDIVRRTVVYWEGAPIPYSDEARDNLTLEIVAQWAAIILQKSRLGSSDADFLARS